MNKKYVEIRQDYEEEYLMYKTFCDSNNVEIPSYEDFDLDSIDEILDEKFGKQWNREMYKTHGLKFKTYYNDPEDLGSWTTAYEVVDQNLFEKTNTYHYLKDSLFEEPDVYFDEEYVETCENIFNQRVDRFFGDD